MLPSMREMEGINCPVFIIEVNQLSLMFKKRRLMGSIVY